MAASASAVAGRKTNALSERFVSRASACIVAASSGSAAMNTASAFPASARSVNTSQSSSLISRISNGVRFFSGN
jgi:hypothetical protein